MRGLVSAKPLLSRPEQILYGRLVRAFPGHIILGHVALSRLLVGGTDTGADGPAGARFRHLIADFVVCKSDFTALAVVELGGASPGDAQRESGLKDQFLQAAGIKVVRLPLDDLPNEAALKALVAALPLNAPARVMRRAS